MSFIEVESLQCAFCLKSNDILIDMGTNSIELYDEIVEFTELVRNVFDCKLKDDRTTAICEECKNLLIQFHVFKQNTERNSFLISSANENIEKVKVFLEETEEEVFCMRYNKCFTLVPESKRSFMETFKHWQPHVVIEKISEIPRLFKPEIAKVEEIETRELVEEECLEEAQDEETQDEEWIQREIANSAIIETEEGEVETWTCTNCDPTEQFFDPKDFRSHLSSHVEYEQIFLDPHEADTEDIEMASQEDYFTIVQKDPPTLHNCTKCDFVSSELKELRIHQKAHVDEKSFQSSKFERLFCADCSYQFTSQAHYQAHINGHLLYSIVAKHSTYPICEECNMMFCDDSFDADHRKSHDNQSELIEHPFESEGLFLKFGHYRPELETPVDGLNESSLKCGHCLRQFLDEETCRLHQLIFHVTTLKCPIEDRTFKGNQAFSIHMKNNHPDLFGDDVKFRCSVCKMQFDTLYEKLGHMKNCDKKRFQCSHCDKKFSQKCYLMTHLKQVSGQTSVVCEVCQKVCRDRGDYQIHFRSHSNVKPFKCSICPKAYKTSSARAAHLETHMAKGFTCEFCNLKFKSRRTLQKHTKTKHASSD